MGLAESSLCIMRLLTRGKSRYCQAAWYRCSVAVKRSSLPLDPNPAEKRCLTNDGKIIGRAYKLPIVCIPLHCRLRQVLLGIRASISSMGTFHEVLFRHFHTESHYITTEPMAH
jgi:hypothetical protein